jgi:hypothetical protein
MRSKKIRAIEIEDAAEALVRWFDSHVADSHDPDGSSVHEYTLKQVEELRQALVPLGEEPCQYQDYLPIPAYDDGR